MGVFNVFNRFIILLYSLFLTFIVFINLCSFAGIDLFSGGPWSALESASTNTFDNSYFGFQSIINAIDDYPASTFGTFLPKIFSTLLDGLSGAFYRLSLAVDLLEAGDFWGSVLSMLEGILDFLFAPVLVLITLVAVLVILCGEIVNFLYWVSRVVGGFYNIPITTL